MSEKTLLQSHFPDTGYSGTGISGSQSFSGDDLVYYFTQVRRHLAKGKVEEACALLNEASVERIRQFCFQNPSFKDQIFELGHLLCSVGQLSKARQYYLKILDSGTHPSVYNKLGTVCQQMGRITEGVDYHRRAVELDRGNPELSANLARAMIETGDIEQGVSLLRSAVEKMPHNAQAHSNLLFRLHHLPVLDQVAIFEEHKRWARLHAPAEKAKRCHRNTPDPDRKLKIGYLSAEFRMNSVSYFIESILDGHDRDRVTVIGYGNVSVPDGVTARLSSKFDFFHNIHSMSDTELVERIESDEVDILVDLAGHTGDNRLTAMAYKPAPIQVTYCGYPNTTGLTAIDYRLTERSAEDERSQQFYSEELYYLPEGFLCYRPAEFAPTVSELPAKKNGSITFGSFNNPCKINPMTIEVWSRILAAIPNSRLILKFKTGGDAAVKDFYLSLFEKQHISKDRVHIYGWETPRQHLDLYNQVDIGLDTYPYNGTTTTCEALWMGVPVISLFGRAHASRVGLSLLGRVGFEFFAANNADAYVQKAIALAKGIDSLEQLRLTMRARIARSGLCHARAFTRDLEAAYRDMWHRWIRSRK